MITDTHTLYCSKIHHLHSLTISYTWFLLTRQSSLTGQKSCRSESVPGALCHLDLTLGVRNNQISNEPSALDTCMLQDGAFGSSWSDVSATVNSSVHITKRRVFPAWFYPESCSSKCACLFRKEKQCQPKPVQFVHDAGDLAFAAWISSERSRQVDFARNQMGPMSCCVFDHESYMLQNHW